ncbi:MAG: radical SAM protein [Nitrososphaerales archaeon]
MTKIVLTADRTLMSEFREIPNLGFLACASSNMMPEFLFKMVAKPIPNDRGRALKAPYGLRKVEAALLKDYKPEEVVVADPDYLENFIKEDTKIVGVNVMEAFGLGPLTMLATWHGGAPSFCTTFFTRLIKRIDSIRKSKNLKFRIVVGGSGAWQFEFQPFRVNELNIDHVIIGEVEHVIAQMFKELEENSQDYKPIIRVKGFPKVSEIPLIVNPSCHDLVEVMRGCGRNCEFCEPNLRASRYYPYEAISEEIKLNIKHGGDKAWLQTEDIFLYSLEDRRNFLPNKDALKDLFRMAITIKGVNHSNATHGTVAPAAADPDLIRELSEIIRAGPDNWIGIQTGIETGSSFLIKKWMPLKCKPFSPEEWEDVVFEGTRVFNENYWFPVYTMITGLPGETEEDVWESIRLIDRMEKELPKLVGKEKTHFWIGVFPFIPIGVMRGEEAFDFNKRMTEARFLLFYRVYKHMIYELTNPHPGTLKGPWINLTYRLFGPIGSWMLSKFLKDFSKTYGYDLSKAENP